MSDISIDDVNATVLHLESLPIVDSFVRRLGIRTHIDSLCPSRSNAKATHGQIVECLIANKLSAPRPLYDIQYWAETLAVPEVFGVTPADLNDDRIGRALDAIAPHIQVLQGNIVASAISAFSLDVSTIHWDLTSLVFAGEYPEEEQESDYPSITYGYSSRNFKQVRLGHGVTPDGAVPIWQKVHDGNENDVATVVKTMRALIKHARLTDFLMVGDSKLLSNANILAFIRSDLKFLAPAASSKALDAEFLSIPKDQFQQLDYLSERQEKLPPDQRNSYLGCQRLSSIIDPQIGKSYTLRRLFVISSEERAARRKNRSRQMQRAAAELEKLTRTAGSRYYPTPDKVLAKASQILKEKRVSLWFITDVKEQHGELSFSYSVNEEALANTEALDGFYVLLTNLSPDEADSSQLLLRYKGQNHAERRFKESKHVLSVRPLFLTSNRRIEALVFVIGLALMVFSLIEREARRNLPNPKDKIPGLLAGHVPARPTGQNILRAFYHFHAVVVSYHGQKALRIPHVTTVQATLLRLLGVPEIRYG